MCVHHTTTQDNGSSEHSKSNVAKCILHNMIGDDIHDDGISSLWWLQSLYSPL
jgi:hypothetical protein